MKNPPEFPRNCATIARPIYLSIALAPSPYSPRQRGKLILVAGQWAVQLRHNSAKTVFGLSRD